MSLSFTEEDFSAPGLSFSEEDFAEPEEQLQVQSAPAMRPEDWLSLPPEEQIRLIDLANQAENQQLTQEAERKRIGAIKTSALGTLGREAVAGVLPAAAAVYSSIPGGLAGAPAGLPGVIAGSTATGLAGGAAAHDIQDFIAESIAPESYARFKDLIKAGREQHPGYALGGRVAANLPSVKASIPKGIRDVAVRAGLGGTLAGIPAFAEGRLPTKSEALEGAINALVLGGPRGRALQPITVPGRGAARPPTPEEIMSQAELEGKVVQLPEKPAAPPAPAPLPIRFDLNAPVMEAAPSGLQMAKPVTRPLPPREGGIKATPEMLAALPDQPFPTERLNKTAVDRLIAEGALQEIPTPDLLSQPIEQGPALQKLRADLNDSITRASDFEKARAEKVSQLYEQPLTDNQLQLTGDSLRKAILENQGKGERRGIISGSALEKWADGVLGKDPRVRVSLNPIDVLAKDIPALAIKGAALVEKGVIKFADWSEAMIKAHGKDIEPLLKRVFVQSLHLKGGEKPNASRIQETATLHGAVREPAVEGAGKVPAQEGSTGVQPQAQEGVQAARAAVDDLVEGGVPSERPQETQEAVRLAVEAPGVNSIRSFISEGKDLSQDNAAKLGISVTTPEGIEQLRKLRDKLQQDYQSKKSILGQRQLQFAREAYEAATGTGGGIAREVTEIAKSRAASPLAIPEGAKPEAVSLANEHRGRVSELEQKAAEAKAASNAAVESARKRAKATNNPELLNTPKIQELTQTHQALEEAVNILKNQPEAAPAPIRQPSEIPAGALGIAPKGTAELQSWLNKALGRRKPRTEGGTPELEISKTPLPDLGDHATNKKVFAEPFGFEAVPYLGALWGGTRRLSGNLNESLTTYWNERQRGKAVSSALSNEYSWVDDTFTIKDGNITNVEPTRPGQSIEANAVMESLKRNPDSYKLTPDQRKAIDAIKQLEPDFGVLESKYGLERADYDITGWEQGIADKLASRAESLYRRAAMQRFVNDKAVGGKNRAELEAQLRITHAEELKNGTLTDDSIKRMVDSAEARGRVMHPAFYNKIFDEATAKALNKHFPNTNRTLSYMAASANNALKSMELGFDMGVGFIQGQGLMIDHPLIWSRANAYGVKAFGDPRFAPNYFRQNIEAVRELAQMGSSVGRIAEQDVGGLGTKELLGRIPGVGKAAGAFGRQFSTFLDVAKVELWKSMRETVPKDQWHKTVQSIESMLSTSVPERSGISRKRALVERVMLLAPAFYRGAINNLGSMLEKGVSGQVARRSIGSLALGGAALFYGAAKGLGMSDEEIKQRFNPMRSDFMMWKTDFGGKKVEIGFGGIYRSLLRLAGNIAKTSIEEPGNWKFWDSERNPIMKWVRGHSGPVVGGAWDLFSGKDYMGDDVDIRGLPLGGIPATLQKVAKPLAEGKPLPTGRELVASFAGLSAYPGKSATQEIYSKANDYLKSIDQERPKLPPEEEVSYGKLRRALRDNEKETAKKLMDELIAKKGSAQVKKTMRERSKHPFTGKAEFEKKFKSGLTDKELDLYYKARDEQRDEYDKFLDLL